jgi:transcriptional antiterminator NusG
MSDINEISAPGPAWYVAHTYSGYENKVKANLEKIVENRGLQDVIMECRIPVMNEVEEDGTTENGVPVKKEVENKVFPSYVLIKMIMSDETWHVIRNIRGVTGFVGPGSKPVPLSDEEVAAIGIEIQDKELDFGVADFIRIKSGSFIGREAKVEAISENKKKITVLINMFGREMPAELDAADAELLQI